MSYLVLARKYRPQTFADLVGQEQVSRTLQNALATGRVAHAYLFSGPRGVGKTTAARLLAMSLSCLAENVADRPCGVCENCLEIQSGQAVDVIEVDGASNRGINEIRDLRETVKYLPGKSRYKVYIIDEVHALTKDAFNALLKTLEEPPPHVVFIFATTETHKVLPTILSRCQRYDFRRIRVEDIAARLAQVAKLENIEAEPEALEIIARQAEGGLRDSLSLMDQAIAAGGGSLTAEDVRRSLGLIDQVLVRTVVQETLAGNGAGALAALDEAYLRGYDFKDLGLKILEYIRGLTLIKVDQKNAAALNITESEEGDYLDSAAVHSLETLHRHFEAWLKFQRDLAYSPQPRWLLEAQVIRLSQLAPLMPVSELVERLGRLLAQNPPPPRPAGYLPSASPLPGGTSTSAVGTPGPQSLTSPPHEDRARLAQRSEAPSDSAETEVRPLNWDAFLRTYGARINDWARDKLKGSTASQFSPEAVTVVLRPGEPLASFLLKQLQDDNLLPLLEKSFGVRPLLTIIQPQDPSTDADYLAERLEEFKKAPEVQSLMNELPGLFTEFRLNPPGEDGTLDDVEESYDNDPAENGISDGSIDNDDLE